jgi:chromate transporter
MWELFLVFFEIGLFTFGGGYAMMSLIKGEVVTRGWLSQEQFYNFIAISETTPGPFAINVATFVGTQHSGILGALVTTSALILPSFIVISIVYYLYSSFINQMGIQAFLKGIKIAVVGIIGVTGVELLIKELNKQGGWAIDYKALIIIVIIAPLMYHFKKISPIIWILLGGVLGILVNLIK